MRNNDKGFAALMSTIIISIILLLIATTLGFTGFSSRFNILDSEMKERSSALAEACVDTALLRLVIDSSYPYPLNESVNVAGNTCTIVSVTNNMPLPEQTTVQAKADYKHYITNLTIVTKSSDSSVLSWEEISN